MEKPSSQTLFESVPGAYLVLASDLTIIAVTDAYLRATMTTRTSLLGRNLFEVFPDNPDDPGADGVRNLARSLERVKATLTPDTMAVQKYDIRRPDGTFEERHWSPRNFPVLDADGNLSCIIHRVEDVTDYVALRARGEEMEREIYTRALEIQKANDEIRALNASLEDRVRARTEELRKAEEKFRLAQKMEAVGRLTGGIAHDFNNMLAVILTYTSLLEEQVADGGARRDLEQVRAAAERAGALTRQLLSFSSQQVTQPRVLDINALVSDLDRMLRRVLGEDIILRTVLAPDVARVRADPSQIDQVIANLVVNARDAMPEGGTITIETRNTFLDASGAPPQVGVTEGPYVLLTVTDTGVGMDAQTLSRIFEPFFTTKERGKGTGLGLATTYGIVRQAGGYVWAYSEPGRGTVFKVYLPAIPEAAEPALALNHEPPRGGTETILLVEDEPLVSAAATAILQKAGYTVVVATDAASGLVCARERASSIALVLTDLVMPGMDGRAFVRTLADVLPRVKVVYMSGYTDRTFEDHVLGDDVPFLQKPFTPRALLERIRVTLDGA